MRHSERSPQSEEPLAHPFPPHTVRGMNFPKFGLSSYRTLPAPLANLSLNHNHPHYFYCNCARHNNRLPSSTNSVCNLPGSSPAAAAASISVASNIDVATSALHSRQYVSLLPGNSHKSVRFPQTPHCRTAASVLLPFGPQNMDVPSHCQQPNPTPQLELRNHPCKKP